MPDFLRSTTDTLRGLDARNALEILVIAAAIFWLLHWLRGTSAMSLLRGIAIVATLLALLSGVFNLTVLNWLLRNSLTAVLVAIPIIFQPELRRALERVGRTGMRSWRGRLSPTGQSQIIAESAAQLARVRHGALIVFEGETGLEDYVATGVRLDALPSVPLMQSIFYINSALHDGAVIVRDGRVAAASCTLPLAEATLDSHLGTRHRAALGISDRTDALAVVVSEETGEISLASDGRFLRPLTPQRLRELLDTIPQRRTGEGTRRPPHLREVPVVDEAPGETLVAHP